MVARIYSGADRLSPSSQTLAQLLFWAFLTACILSVGGGRLAVAAPLCPDVVRIGYLADWAPYQYTDREGQPQGVDVEAARRAITAAGCPVRMVEVGWPRVMSLLEKGVIDMVAGFSETPERAAVVDFSAPYRRETIGLFVRQGDSKVYPMTALADIESLRFRLGVTAGAYYGEEFASLMTRPAFRSHVMEVSGSDSPGLVAIGRIDGYLLDTVSADAAIHATTPPLALERHPGVLIDNGPIHFAFSRVRISPALVARINDVLPAGDGAGWGPPSN